MQITALSSWYGSNRMLGEHVGKALEGCAFVAVPFCGGLSELAHIRCRTGIANDLHRHVINLAKVTSCPRLGPALWRRLRRLAFHPDTLAEAQEECLYREGMTNGGVSHPEDRVSWAASYFVCSWMARNGTAGTKNEFSAGLSYRWEAGGGDSVVRFRNAIEGLREWREILSRWTFDCRDAFEFLTKCKDKPGHGLYIDPPFPGPGRDYKHNCGKTDAEERTWHERLAGVLTAYQQCRVVCRFYDVPLIRQLYPEDRWRWHFLEGRKQTNDRAPEVLLVNSREEGLYDVEGT